MKIKLLSDLHLEFGKFDLQHDGADVLVIAGDLLIVEYLYDISEFDMTNRFTQNLLSNKFLKVIKDDGNYISKTFYVRFNNGTDCYTIKPMKIYLVHLVKNKDQFNICDVKNDNSETITLSTYAKQINNQSGSKVFYFNTEAQALANVSGTDIKSLTVTSIS